MKRLADRHKLIPAAYVIFRDNDKILLIRRANTGYHDGEYSLPAGHVGGTDERGNEPAIMAACREAKEEVGVIVSPQGLRLVHTMHRKSTDPEPHERIDLYFEASKWHGKLRNAEPNKCDKLRWVLMNDLPRNMVPEVRQALSMVAKHDPYSEFNFA